MGPANAARGIAAGRVLIGLAMIIAPRRLSRGWVGDVADSPSTHVLVRALGIRDLLLGLLTLHVIGKPGAGKRTVAACAVADAVDFAATVAARDAIPRAGTIGVGAIASSAALAGFGLAAAMDE